MVKSRLADNKRFSRSVVYGLLSACVLSTAALTGCATLQSSAPAGSYGVPVTDRTIAQRILDQSIVNTAKTNINAMDPTLYKRSRIGVDSFYSQVLLTGEVPDEDTKKKVVQIVSAMPDVKEVYDKLTVGPQKGTSYTVHDGYISSKINAKIIANNAISSSQIKVVSDDGIVYVMGKLTPTQRGHLMNIVESTVGIKELVLLTELIDNNGVPIDESSVIQETQLEPPDRFYTTAPEPVAYPATQQAANTAVPQNNNAQTQGSVNNTQPTTNQQPITQGPSRPRSGEPYASPYIEMYKNQVPGW